MKNVLPYRAQNGFTLIELLVVISIIALLIGLLLPALGAARKTARQLASSTQLRGIHQGMVVFAQSNKSGGNDGFFPGLNADGTVAANPFPGSGEPYVVGGNKRNLPQCRFAIMLNENLFTPDYIMNPADPGVSAAEANSADNFSTLNYSYAMLSLGGAQGAGTDLQPQQAGRKAEWKETLNTQAVVLSDINTGSNNFTAASSWWTEENSGEWGGGIIKNDNSTSYESTSVVENTKYGNYPVRNSDNLFVNSDNTNPTSDAIMIFGFAKSNDQESTRTDGDP